MTKKPAITQAQAQAVRQAFAALAATNSVFGLQLSFLQGDTSHFFAPRIQVIEETTGEVSIICGMHTVETYENAAAFHDAYGI